MPPSGGCGPPPATRPGPPRRRPRPNGLAGGAAAPGRRRAGVSLATLRLATAAIRLAHLAAGQPFESRHPAILLVLKGIARERPALPIQAAPLRAAMVRDILARLGDSPLELRDGALIALGYCFARRRAELAGLDLERLGSGSGTLLLTRRAIELCLARSKTGVDGTTEAYVAPAAENADAVKAIRRWLACAGVAPGEPVLRRVYKSGRIGRGRLDPQSVSLALKRRIEAHLRACGATEDEARQAARAYSGHSLRVGFAVTAAEAGADIGAIQQALGHRSPAMAARYSRAASLARTSPHRLPGVGLSRTAGERARRRR